MTEKIKRKVLGFYRHLNIQNKILFSLYLVILVVGCVSFGLSYYYTYQSAVEDDRSIYQKNVESVSSRIENLQQDVLDITGYMGTNGEIHSVLAEPFEGSEKKRLFWFSDMPISFIQNTLAVKSQFRTLILYPEDGKASYYISRDSSVHKTRLDELRHTEYYRRAEKAGGDLVWFYMGEGENGIYKKNTSAKIVGIKMIYNLSKSRKLALVAMGMDFSRYVSVCDEGRFSKEESIVVTDGQGNALITVGNLKVEDRQRGIKGTFDKEDVSKIGSYYVFRGKSEESGMQIYYFSPVKIWIGKALKVLAMPLMITFAILICMWPVSLLLSRVIVRPLKGLYESMDRFRHGNLWERVKVERDDEICQLANSFNKMAEDIQKLIDQNYVMALREKESELNILQAQINPHFLYNVLDSLYWQAVDVGDEKLENGILALSNLFRLVLNQGQEMICVEKEFELVRSYLEIQKMRLNKRLSYEIDLDASIAKCRISKLLIQPFVENAVVHGLENRKTGGFVKVKGYQRENYLVFTVEDNGVGMQEDEVDRLARDPESMRSDVNVSHYAVFNIRERLRLRYQDDYKLEISSRENLGTLVRLVIPMEGEKAWDEKNYSLLIADDDEAVLKHMKKYIEKHTECFERVYCAEDGQEALDLIFKYRPDLLLLDVQMPVKSGLDVMKEANLAGKCPKTVILSGYDTFSYAQQALRLGAVDYLLKPCRATAVLEKLERLVLTGEEKKPGGEKQEENRVIKAALAYIREHIAEEISQTVVAEHVGVTGSYLSTLFAREFGCGFVDYLNRQKIEFACDYMHDDKMKIYEIAYRVGFRDEKYFSKVFKKVTGKSPSEYRRSL